MNKDKVVKIGNNAEVNTGDENVQNYMKRFKELTDFDVEVVKIFTLNSNPDVVCIGVLDKEREVLTKCAKLIYKEEKIKMKNEKGKTVEKTKPMALFIPFGFPINYEMYHEIKTSDVSLIQYVGENDTDFVKTTHSIVRKQFFLEFLDENKNAETI